MVIPEKRAFGETPGRTVSSGDLVAVAGGWSISKLLQAAEPFSSTAEWSWWMAATLPREAVVVRVVPLS